METIRERTTPPDEATGVEPGRKSFLVLLFLGIAILWVAPMWSSLWLDETGTYWVIEDDLSTAIDRAARFHGQTPLYYVIVWTVKTVAGSSEVALRAPSFLAMALALFLLYRIARRLSDSESARMVTIVFVANPAISFAAADARSYAIGMAIFLGATLALIRWLDERNFRDGVLYVLLAGGTVYLHFLLAPALAAHALYAWRRRGHIRWRAFALVCGGIALVLLPALPQLLSLFSRRESLSVPTSPGENDLFNYIAPAVLCAGILIGLLAARATGPISIATRAFRRGAPVLAAASLLIVPVSYFLISEFTSTFIFTRRYLITATIGLTLLAGWGIASVAPARARRIVALAILICATVLSKPPHHFSEGWREAIAAANATIDRSDTPVLLHSGFIESAQIDWLTHPERARYLSAPIAAYPIEGRPIPLPFTLDDRADAYDDRARAYLERVMTEELLGRDRFLLIVRYHFSPFKAWFDGRSAEAGFVVETLGHYGGIGVHDYRRIAGSTAHGGTAGARTSAFKGNGSRGSGV